LIDRSWWNPSTKTFRPIGATHSGAGASYDPPYHD
jgi:hypothetical protein